MKSPPVSLIIPIKNEESCISKCLSEISNQTYPSDKTELLVVDGMSTDSTRERICRFGAENECLDFRIIDNPKGQRASALNAGIREAKGDIILRIDARTIIPPDYVEKCVEALEESGADNAGGMQRPKVDGLHRGNLTQFAVGIAMSSLFGVGNARFRTGRRSGFTDTVYLGCFRKELFEKVGLFDEDSAVISEDADMNFRIRQAGGKIYFNKDVVAYYYPRGSFKELWRLYFRYGGAKAGNLIKRGKLTAFRQHVPPFFLLALVLLPLLGLFNRLFLFLWLAVCGSYLLAALLASVHAVLNSNSVYAGSNSVYAGLDKAMFSLGDKIVVFSRLLFAFPTMHMSWALGFFKRLMQRPKPGEYWSN